MSYPPQGTRINVGDADAEVGDVKAGKTFYSAAAPRKTGIMPTKAIVATNDDYEAGYHEGNPGGLAAIDTDLAPANIKEGIAIFGKLGTLALTLTLTEQWAPNDYSTDEASGTDWKTVEETNLTSGKFIAWIQGRGVDPAAGSIRILVDEVQKLISSSIPYAAAVHYGGDYGVVKLQIKTNNADYWVSVGGRAGMYSIGV